MCYSFRLWHAILTVVWVWREAPAQRCSLPCLSQPWKSFHTFHFGWGCNLYRFFRLAHTHILCSAHCRYTGSIAKACCSLIALQYVRIAKALASCQSKKILPLQLVTCALRCGYVRTDFCCVNCQNRVFEQLLLLHILAGRAYFCTACGVYSIKCKTRPRLLNCGY